MVVFLAIFFVGGGGLLAVLRFTVRWPRLLRSARDVWLPFGWEGKGDFFGAFFGWSGGFGGLSGVAFNIALSNIRKTTHRY